MHYISSLFGEVVDNDTLKSETFEDQPNSEIFTFRGNKLSITEKKNDKKMVINSRFECFIGVSMQKQKILGCL